jgi:hypothetical protein
MKQFIISVVVMFILSMGLGFAVHGALLKSDYDLLPNLMRTEAGQQRHFPAMLLAHVFIAVGLTALYRRGRVAGKGVLAQGFCFGLMMAIVSCIPGYLIYYAVEPMPLTLVCKQIVLDSIATIVLGLAVAGLNKQSA